MQNITANVFVETGFQSCNTGFVVTEGGVVVIDTPMIPQDAKKWKNEAEKHGTIMYVINTESHTDHISGNCYFSCDIISHEGTREAILNQPLEELENMLKRFVPHSLPIEEGFHFRPPSITYSQQMMTLYLGNHTFQLIHLPGHTPFQTVVYIPEEGVAFASDNLSLAGPVFPENARPFEWLESLIKIQTLGANILVPGHGEACSPEDVPRMAAQVKEWIDTVSLMISKGMTLEETVENFSLPGRKPGALNSPIAKHMQHRSVKHLYGILINEIKES